MTFEEYIKNPMGAGSSVVSNRQMYQQMYTEKWNALKVRENGIVNYKLYEDGDTYYIYLKIPSEVVPKFYYDTIIKFYIPKDKKSGVIEKSLSNYDVQFYSNDPSFVYTFAHAFKKNNMLIKDLEPKMSVLALKEKPIQKNPKDDIGYVKSLYFAYLEIKSLNLFNKAKWDGICSPYSKYIWSNIVTHADDKIRDRQEKGNALTKKKKRETNTENNRQRESKVYNNSSPNIPNFGHFKKTNFNITKNARNTINKSIGKFKNTVK